MRGLREEFERVERSTTDIAERQAAAKRLVDPDLRKEVIGVMVDFLCEGEVPKEFDAYTHVQFENDDGPRILEMEVKLADRRTYSYQKYGVNIEFHANTKMGWLQTKGQSEKNRRYSGP